MRARSVSLVMQVQFAELFRSFRKSQVAVPDECRDKARGFAELTWGTPPWAEYAADLREMLSKGIESTAMQLILQPLVTQAFGCSCCPGCVA